MFKNDLLSKDNGEALILLNKLEKLNNKRNKLVNEINEATKKLKDVCIHNDTEIVNDYIPGGYLDREVYIKKLICKTCGKELDREETLGGFG